MSDVNKKYVDYAGLSKYDQLIKGQIQADAANAAAAAVEALDVTEFPVAEKDSNTNAITIHGVKEADGKVAVGTSSANDMTLAPVAATGAAEDVTYDNTTSGISATNLQDAIDAIADATAGGVEAKTVYITEESGGSSAAYSKKYGIYQGKTGSSSSPVAAEKLVDIDIPKDMVVEDGAVVDVVFVDADSSLHEGSASGTDVTTEIKGSGTATSADAGKYIKLTIANATAAHLWIKATDLVDIYTAAQGATEVQLVIDNNNEISASIVAVAATKVTHGNSTVEAALNTLEGDATTAGSVAKAEADAKTYADNLVADLDTTSDVALASHDSSTGAVTFAGSVAEADGLIEAGSADNVIFTPVTNSEIQALFPSTSA